MQDAPARTPSRPKSASRLGHLTLLTFLVLFSVTMVIALWGRSYALDRIERAYIDIHGKAASDQAYRIARLLEQELEAGVPAETVRRHLQESLSRNPYDEAGFLCLLDDAATVLCHPDLAAVGMQVPFTGEFTGSLELLKGQAYAGDTHLVSRHPVEGMPWQVSIHSNYGVIKQRLEALRDQISLAALPVLGGIVIFGTLAVRSVGRRYERRIEDANRDLEAKVASRTAELLAASRYHQEIIEAAPSAIFLCDRERRIVEANGQAAALTGVPVESLSGRGLDEFVAFDPAVGTPPGSPQEGTVAREAKLKGVEGTERFLHVFGNEIRNRSGSELMFVIQDVSNLKTLEREFLQAQKMEAVGRLAGGVAHDFNNQLAVVMGFVDLARLDNPGAAVRSRLDQAIAACRRAARVCQQLLTFSRKQAFQPEVCTLPGLLDESRKMLDLLVGAEIEVRVSHEGGPWEARLDASQFEQALLNLAINARDAMAGRGRITLRSRNLPAGRPVGAAGNGLDADHVCLEVEDAGPGIPAGLQQRIFEPFFTTKPVGKGTGLGLASVMGIVQQHGGRIELHSEVGKGSCFSLLFPRHRGPAATVATGTERGMPASGRGARLLLVEDEPHLNESLCELLSAVGFDVRGALSRNEALEMLGRNEAFEFILCDVVMAGASLGHFLAEVGKSSQAPRVVLMSGFADEEILAEARQHGIPVLGKPFTLNQLTAVLTTAGSQQKQP